MRTGVWMVVVRSARSERLGREGRRPDVPTPVRPRRRDGVHVRQPVGEAEPALREHGVLLVDGQRDRAAAAAAEEEAVRAVIGRPRPVPGQVWTRPGRTGCRAAPSRVLASDPATAR